MKSSGIYVKADVKEVKRNAGEVAYEITATLDDEVRRPATWMSDLTLTTNAVGIEKMRVPVNGERGARPINGLARRLVKFGALPMGDAKSFDVTVQRARSRSRCWR